MEALYSPSSVEGVFADFEKRRMGLIKALTTEKDKFLEMCDPEKECLCLYGNPNGSWEVRLPSELAPPELPEPVLGVNIARNAMQNKEWRLFVAVRSDSWLISVTFYSASLLRFGRRERNRLFTLINELPTIYEVVNQEAKPPKHQVSYQKGSQRRSSQEKQPCGSEHHNPVDVPALWGRASDGDKEFSRGGLLCSTDEDDIWIRCEMCDRWFRDLFESKQYKCPRCRDNSRGKAKVIWVSDNEDDLCPKF